MQMNRYIKKYIHMYIHLLRAGEREFSIVYQGVSMSVCGDTRSVTRRRSQPACAESSLEFWAVSSFRLKIYVGSIPLTVTVP